MQYLLRKWWGVAVVALAILIASLVQMATPAVARERQTMLEGVTACKQACDRNNRTVTSQHACYMACESYWMCNDSDATAETCADRPSLSAMEGTSDPPARPRRSDATHQGRTDETP
jgi:hypothetical protein